MTDDLDSNATVGGVPITAALDGEEPDEVLGYCTMVTTGDHLLIPREWLEDKWDQYGLPGRLFPKKIRPWMAYGRMTNILLDRDEEEDIYIPEYDEEFRVRFSVDSGEEKQEHLVAHVFYPEDVIGESGGKWVDRNLGYFDYQREDDDGNYPTLTEEEDVLHDVGGARVVAHTKIEPGTKLHDRWKNRFVARAKGLFLKMQTHNIGQDMRDVVDQFLFEESNTVRYQNGTYFVGAQHTNTIEGLAKVWQEMNRFKDRGQQAKIRTIPVMNTEKQREYIKDEVWKEAKERVNDAIDEALEKLEEEVEQDAEQIAAEILEATSDAEDFAEEYNELLETRMDVKEILKERRSELTDEKEELLNRVIDQSSLHDY